MSFAIFGATRPQRLALAVLLALIVLGPFFAYPFFIMQVLCFALFACAFNLLVGYVGLMSFGHAAFFGMGSYVSAYAAKTWHVTPELGILLGALVGCLLGAPFGWLSIRRTGINFSMITLALAQMVFFFCLESTFTGGDDGIQNVPRGALFGLIPLQSDMAVYWTVAVIFVFGFLLIQRIIHSPFGQVIKAIRENEQRAISLGYPINHYKLGTFILSAAIAGAAGGTKAIAFGIATLTDVDFQTSGDVVLMTLVGGLGTIFGPVVGSVLIISMEHYLAGFGSWITVTQGLVFIVCMVALRRGVIGTLQERLKVEL